MYADVGEQFISTQAVTFANILTVFGELCMSKCENRLDN